MEPFFIRLFLISSKFEEIFPCQFFLVSNKINFIEMINYRIFNFLFILIKSEGLKASIDLIKHLWNSVNNFGGVFLNFLIISIWVVNDFIVDFLVKCFYLRKVITVRMGDFTFTVIFYTDYCIFLTVLLAAVFIGRFKERTLELKSLKKIRFLVN